MSLFANFYSNTKSLHLFWEESRLNSANFTEKVSFCVNSWKFNSSPKSSAQLPFVPFVPFVPFAMNSMSALAMASIAVIASTSTVKSQQWIMRDKKKAAMGSGSNKIQTRNCNRPGLNPPSKLCSAGTPAAMKTSPSKSLLKHESSCALSMKGK